MFSDVKELTLWTMIKKNLAIDLIDHKTFGLVFSESLRKIFPIPREINEEKKNITVRPQTRDF